MIWNLEIQNQQLSESNESKESELTRCRVTLKSLQDQLSSTTDRLEILRGTEASLEEEKSLLLSKLEHEVSSRRRIVSGLQKEKKDLLKTLQDLSKEAPDLVSRYGSLGAYHQLSHDGGNQPSTPSRNGRSVIHETSNDTVSILTTDSLKSPTASPSKHLNMNVSTLDPNSSVYIETLSASLSYTNAQNETLQKENAGLVESVTQLQQLLADAQETIELLQNGSASAAGIIISPRQLSMSETVGLHMDVDVQKSLTEGESLEKESGFMLTVRATKRLSRNLSSETLGVDEEIELPVAKNLMMEFQSAMNNGIIHFFIKSLVL
jgi:hypothetical protein